MYRSSKPSWSATAQPVAEMQMTPLIGVLQALMVVALVALPIASAQSTAFSFNEGDPPICGLDPEPARLSVKQTGELYLDGMAVNRAQLKAHLAELAASNFHRKITIFAEPETSFENFADAVTMVNKAGLVSLDAGIDP